MSGIVNEVHARVKARIWQSIAQSGLDLSPLPQDTMNAFVDIVTEAALLETDNALAASAAKVSPEAATGGMGEMAEGEKVLWEGRPLLSVVTHYRITNERVRITYGLLGKQRLDIELLKIQEITQTQKLGERILNVGDITLKTHYLEHPTLVLENVSDVQRVHEILRRAMLDAREDANFAYREEM